MERIKRYKDDFARWKENNKIKRGMRFEVTSPSFFLQHGWPCQWLANMYNCLNEEGKVAEVDEHSVYLQFEDGKIFAFPFFVLEHIPEVKAEEEEEGPIFLPFTNGRTYASEMQMERLDKWYEDCKRHHGNIPWIVIDAKGEIWTEDAHGACIAGVHNEKGKLPSMERKPVLFLRISNTDNKLSLELHEDLTNHEGFAPYLVHFYDDKLKKKFIGIKMYGIPLNAPLFISTHLRLLWDSHNKSLAKTYKLLYTTFPKKFSPREMLVLSFCLRHDEGITYSFGFDGGCHTLFGSYVTRNAINEYLIGHIANKRYDPKEFKFGTRSDLGISNAMSYKSTATDGPCQDAIKELTQAKQQGYGWWSVTIKDDKELFDMCKKILNYFYKKED